MSGPAGTFREIHRLRRHAQDLQEQLDRIPRQLKAQQAKVARQEEIQREGQEAVKKLKVAVQKKEGEIKDQLAHVKRYQEQLKEIASKKEYDALQHEISHAKDECRRLEDEALLGMEEGEQRAAQLPELEKAVQLAREELARFEQQVEGRKADLTAQLNETSARLKEVEAEVPDALRPQYNRMVASKGPDALSAVRDRACQACHTEITVQSYNELQQELYVTCKSCWRILYLPAEEIKAAEE
jgi:predicted  nucleic acid-binding Zn-ribbon protein